MNWLKRSAVVSVCLSIAACSSAPNPAGTNGLIPATNVALSPTTTVTLEKLVYWGGVAAIAYYVLDPQAPNWEITEAKFPDDHYLLSLKMKRYYAGGAGEAKMTFNRRAKDLANANGYPGYKIVEYSEGLDSNIMGSQRTAEGVIVLTGPKVLPPAPVAPKARAPAAPSAPATVLAVSPTPVIEASPVQQLQATPLPQSKPKVKPKAKPKKRKNC